MNDSYIAALKRERAGYEAQGKDDRVAQVDAELKRVGSEPDPSPEAEKPPVDDGKSQPRGRSGRESRQSTADAEAKPEA